MAAPEIVSCNCKTCSNVLCFSKNEWTGISSSYSTYLDPDIFSHPGLELVEPKRCGSKDSELEGCTVQPLRCVKCKTGVGVKCVEAPREKKENSNRSFLKLARMTLKSVATADLIEANIKPIERLAPAPTLHEASNSSNVEKRDPTTRKSMGPFDVNSEPEGFERPFDTRLELENQRSDIDRMLDAIHSLQEDMNSVRVSISQISNRQPDPFAEEINILTENVSKISKEMSEVERLKFEIKMMQQRLKRVEEAISVKRPSLPAAHSVHDLAGFSTPLTGIRSSPMQTPSNQTGFWRESSLRPLKSGLSKTAKAFSEMPPRGHPLRHEGHKLDQPVYSDQIETVYQDSGLANQHMQTDTRQENIDIATNQAESRLTNDMPPPRAPYSAPGSSTSNYQLTSTNEHGKTLQSAVSTAGVAPPSTGANAMPDVQDTLPTPAYGSDGISTPNDEDMIFVTAQPQMPAPPAPMIHYPKKSHYRRTSVPNRLLTPEWEKPGWQGPTPEAHTEADRARTKRRRMTAFGEATTETVARPAANARPLTSTGGERRDKEGRLIKPNGRIDRRSTRYEFPVKEKRMHRLSEGARDAEGYLLRPDGTRDARSVRIISAARKKRRALQGLA